MRDPFSWSFPIGRLFGITIRLHLLMPIVLLGLIARPYVLQKAPPGTWIDAAWIVGLLFLSVLLHELGHCFAAFRVGGEAREVLLWPLGGLARCDLPHNPWAHFICAAGGPAVNILLCLASATTLMAVWGYQPPWNPFAALTRMNELGDVRLYLLNGEAQPEHNLAVLLCVWTFWVNWILALINLLLIGLPFDAGRMLQAGLWPRVGYRQATLYAIFAGFGIMILLLAVSIVWNEVLLVVLAWYTYSACKIEWLVLETGGEDSVFGYDFSQGYTSLERDEESAAPVRRRRQNVFQRWLQRRSARKIQQQQQRQEEEDRRVDELLQKIQRYGKESLTDEEHRFLKRVSDRFRK